MFVNNNLALGAGIEPAIPTLTRLRSFHINIETGK